MMMDLPEARKANRQKMEQAVKSKLDELDSQFKERDQKIQKIVENEQLDTSPVGSMMGSSNRAPAVTKNLLKMNTGMFI